jgi:cephalosporin-C deacetylase-like acetyl esterase
MATTFDECFSTFPELKTPSDYFQVWQKAEEELKSIPVGGKQRLILKKSLGWESQMEVSFLSWGNTRLQAMLSIPRKRGRAGVIITFHDYHESYELDREFTDAGFAHLALQLRYHNRTRQEDSEMLNVPLFQRYGLHELEKSYPFLCYMDALRAVDFLREQKSIDGERIGIIGRGLGAALSVFAMAHRSSVRAISLEQMGFVAFSVWLKDSQADYSDEIRFMLGKNARQRLKSKKNLEYIDVLNLAEALDRPVLSIISLNSLQNPPRPAFGFFNRLKADKTMELFTDETKAPTHKEMRKKSIAYLAEQLA